jgi:hypothetical protein
MKLPYLIGRVIFSVLFHSQMFLELDGSTWKPGSSVTFFDLCFLVAAKMKAKKNNMWRIYPMLFVAARAILWWRIIPERSCSRNPRVFYPKDELCLIEVAGMEPSLSSSVQRPPQPTALPSLDAAVAAVGAAWTWELNPLLGIEPWNDADADADADADVVAAAAADPVSHPESPIASAAARPFREKQPQSSSSAWKTPPTSHQISARSDSRIPGSVNFGGDYPP